MPRRSANSKSTRPRTRYLTYGDIAAIAYQLAEELFSHWLGPMPVLTILGGEEGAGRLRGILELPKQTAGGKPAYPGLFDKTAVLFRSLVLNHPFVDGNKRIAAASALVFLLINRHVPCPTQAELVQLALAVASGQQKDLDWIAAWFHDRTVARLDLEAEVSRRTVDELLGRLPGPAKLEHRPVLEATIREIEAKLI